MLRDRDVNFDVGDVVRLRPGKRFNLPEDRVYRVEEGTVVEAVDVPGEIPGKGNVLYVAKNRLGLVGDLYDDGPELVGVSNVSAITDLPTQSSVTALTPVTLEQLDIDPDEPDHLGVLSDQLAARGRTILPARTGNADVRVPGVLLTLRDTPEHVPAIGQEEMGRLAGVSRQTTNGRLGDLKMDGVISWGPNGGGTTPREIQILDLDELARRAQRVPVRRSR